MGRFTHTFAIVWLAMISFASVNLYSSPAAAQSTECQECKSGVCKEEGVCLDLHCVNGKKDNSEADVDCGGPDCLPCRTGADCKKDKDCKSDVCSSGNCAAPVCDDGVQNGNEADVDCGGTDCKPCLSGGSCSKDADCQSGVCKDGKCKAPSCKDGVKNGSETDVDCGGPSCPPCSAGKTCRLDEDCESEKCEKPGRSLTAKEILDAPNRRGRNQEEQEPTCK